MHVQLDPAESDRDYAESASSSLDGRTLACGMRSGKVSLCRADGQEQKWTSRGSHSGSGVCVDLSNDNRHIPSCRPEDDVIRIWDIADGDCEGVLRGHQCGVRCVMFLREGKFLASGDQHGGIFLWEVASWRGPIVLKAPMEGVGAVYALATAEAIIPEESCSTAKQTSALISVDVEGRCSLFSPETLTVLFDKQISSISDDGVGASLVDIFGRDARWHLLDWREKRQRRHYFFSGGWSSFQVGEQFSDRRGARINTGSASLKLDLEVVLGPTAESGSRWTGARPCCGCIIRLDSPVDVASVFAGRRAPIACQEDFTGDEDKDDDAPEGTIVVGCGLLNGKIATFEVMGSRSFAI